MTRSWLRPVLAVALVAAGIVAARALGLGEAIRLENLSRLKQWIESYGVLAPVIFIVGYVLAAVLFLATLALAGATVAPRFAARGLLLGFGFEPSTLAGALSSGMDWVIFYLL